MTVKSGSSRNPVGFTLFELPVVNACITIVATTLLPALSKAKQRAQRAQCVRNNRQMILGWRIHSGDSLVRQEELGIPAGTLVDANPKIRKALSEVCSKVQI